MRFLITALLLLLAIASGFSQSRYIPSDIKKIVFTRDAGTCQCCGSQENLEFDHIKPYSCGGGNDVSNIQLLCKTCNRSKSNGCYCKVHDKKVGHDCCDKSDSHNTMSKLDTKEKKSAKSSQCTGSTKKGNRCKNMTKNASGRCHLH